jgi:Fuc2NAc and GlcNAc transferase
VITIVVLTGAFCVSYFLTLVVHRYALRHSMIDIPNQRSSHSIPTPRGGGIAIVWTWFTTLAVLLALGRLDLGVGLALLGGGGAVALVGWLDDRYGLSAVLRACVHLGAAAWTVWALGGLSSLNLGVGVLDFGWSGAVLAVFGIAWLTNLFNFMDGIDGLAGSEAVSVGLVGGGLLAVSGHEGLSLAALALAAAAGGFLVWNWPPAKIFMGDVGSGLLGYGFGTLALASERVGAVPVALWMILLGVFIVDATATLFRRMLGGEQWYQAHRSHAYQRAVQSGYSHRQVTLGVLGLNVLLALVAVGVWFAPTLLPAALVAVGIGLLLLWYRLSRLAPAPN